MPKTKVTVSEKKYQSSGQEGAASPTLKSHPSTAREAHDLPQHGAERAALVRFSEGDHSSENIKFIFKIQELQAKINKNQEENPELTMKEIVAKEEFQAQFKTIFNAFITEITLPKILRETLETENRDDHFTLESFQAACNECHAVAKRDILPRFRKSLTSPNIAKYLAANLAIEKLLPELQDFLDTNKNDENASPPNCCFAWCVLDKKAIYLNIKTLSEQLMKKQDDKDGKKEVATPAIIIFNALQYHLALIGRKTHPLTVVLQNAFNSLQNPLEIIEKMHEPSEEELSSRNSIKNNTLS